MQIVYIYNPAGKSHSDDTEGHIIYALKKLGHEVMEVYERDAESKELRGDFLLFHHWDSPDRLDILRRFRGKKAFWYFDKVWNGRDALIRQNLEVVDKAFLTDGDWILQHPHPKQRLLRQGIGDRWALMGLGKGLAIYPGQIAFTGTIYGPERTRWYAEMKERYGERFQTYEKIHNRNLFDLCSTVPVFIAPTYPNTNNYWSSRVYLTVGSGGFLLHPYCTELQKEFAEGEEIIYYDTMGDLFDKIDYFLEHDDEREDIRRKGFAACKEKYSYYQRVKELCKCIHQ